MKKILVLFAVVMVLNGCTFKDYIKSKVTKVEQTVKEDINKYDEIEIRIIVNKDKTEEYKPPPATTTPNLPLPIGPKKPMICPLRHGAPRRQRSAYRPGPHRRRRARPPVLMLN